MGMFCIDRASLSGLVLACVVCLPLAANAQWGDEQPLNSIDLEAGLLSFSRNEVQIPGDSGTRFALDDLTGSSGTAPACRAPGG